MTEMYVANGTRQAFSFQYRLPEGRQPIVMQLPTGTQIRLKGGPNGLSTADVDAIVAQWATYGMQRVDDVPKFKGIVPVAYQIDRPVTAKQIEAMIFHNDMYLEMEGRGLRKLAAVAVTLDVQQKLVDNNSPAGLKGMDISVVEEEPKNGYDPLRKPLGEGFKYTRGQEPVDQPPARRRGRRAA